MGKLFGKFLCLLLPAFALASGLALILASELIVKDDRSILTSRVGKLAVQVSAILASEAGKPHLDRASLEAKIDILMADPAIRCAEIKQSSGYVLVAAPPKQGCFGQERLEELSLPIGGKRPLSLEIGYSTAELSVIRHDRRILTIAAVVLGLVLAAASSWFGFGFIINRPLRALLGVIQRGEREGAATRIDNPSDDELGMIAQAYNRMQKKLQQEAERNLAALKRLDQVYNETPALMFAVDRDGVIQQVSGFWLEETGYAREEVVGHLLVRFIRHADRRYAGALVREMIEGGKNLRSVPLLLLKKDCTDLDVLLSTVAENHDASEPVLCVMSDVTNLRAAQEELQHQVVTDLLTGLPNRQGLFDHLARLRSKGEHALEEASVLFIDLDNFKDVNDTLGHEAGDLLLQAAASRLRGCVAGFDFLARLGGDEFAVVLHGLKDRAGANVVAEGILQALAMPFQIGEANAAIGASIGIAEFNTNASEIEDTLRLADLAMYKSKQDGRNCVSVYTPDLNARAHNRDRLIRKIRTALDENHLRLFLQPVVRLDTLKPAGAEALLRLQCPHEGLLPPAEIIKIAEETGYMNHIGRWVVREGCAIAERESETFGPDNNYLAINLSPRQIDPEFSKQLVDRLNGNPRLARSIVFEITETALLKNDDLIAEFFSEIRKSGARIALDDFGTGYSSLGHIHRFPVDFIKLDRSFVHSLSGKTGEDCTRGIALIKATATLANELGIAIVAEGIESYDSLELLRSHGVGYGQGYLFSPPLPTTAFRDWMAAFLHRKTFEAMRLGA